MKRRGWLLGLALVLSGCAQWELPPVTERSSMVAVAEPDWLAEVRWIQQLPAAAQPADLLLRQQAYQASADSTSRLRLALLHGLGAEEVRDEARALALLGEIDPDTMSVPQAALADLLRHWLQERQRTQGLLRAERKVLAERDARIRELESQLEAVTSIEQSIRQRQKPLQGVEP